MSILPLSEICAEQHLNSADQRRRLVALLKAGADVNATDKNGVTALHHAVRFNMAASSWFLPSFTARRCGMPQWGLDQ